jgi:transcriptional regulator with AAA-type ATPase domain
VLIQGEMGTGKELLARHIHRESDRAGLFVALSCSSLSQNHAEAELFGYAAGAYSGTASSRAGWFGSANGGTLYLDEIGDLPLALQDKLLAALENREVTRVGAGQASPVDVRLVAATSIDLAQAVEAGKFHPRLYQYLNEGRLALPPLRERIGDILPMAEYFLGIYTQRLGLPMPLIGAAAQQVLEWHPWPGNTRELENVIHFALLVSSGEEILPEHLELAGVRAPLLAGPCRRRRCRAAAGVGAARRRLNLAPHAGQPGLLLTRQAGGPVVVFQLGKTGIAQILLPGRQVVVAAIARAIPAFLVIATRIGAEQHAAGF